jgi:hypothetical protein
MWLRWAHHFYNAAGLSPDRDRAPSRLSPPGNLSTFDAPPGFLRGLSRQGLNEIPILRPHPQGLHDRLGILWLKLHRAPQLLHHVRPLLGRQRLPPLESIQPSAVVGEGSRGLQMRYGLHKLLRPQGSAVGMLGKLRDDIREGLPADAIGGGNGERVTSILLR